MSRPSHFAFASALAFLAPCSLVAPLAAQAARWAMPGHGAAIYAATSTLRALRADGSGLNVFDAASDRCAPVLFAGELVDDGARWLEAPWSLESIPVWLAADLSTWSRPGRVRTVWPRIHRYGEVTFAGTAEPPQQDGWQRITGRLTRRDVRDRPGASDRELELDRHYLADGLDLRLELRRRFRPDDVDAGQRDRAGVEGVIEAIEWTLAGSLAAGEPRAPLTVSGGCSWQLQEIRANRHPAEVGRASFGSLIEAARDAVVARQVEDLRAERNGIAGGESRGSVQGPSLHAAILFGLARAGRRAADPAVAASLAALLGRPQTEPHGHALTILAVTGLHAPADDRQQQLAGRPPRIALPADLQRQVEQRVRALLDLRRETDGRRTGFWTFADDVENRSMFHSCLAVQALDAAQRSGIRVPQEAIDAFARHLIATAIPIDVPRHAALRREAGVATPAPGSRASRDRSTSACAWTDTGDAGFTCHGADVAAAMAALHTCARTTADADLRAQCLATVDRAWSWLGHWFTARHCPSPMPVQRQHHAAFVLAMAWLLDESGVRFLDERDLYFELATELLVETTNGIVPSTVLGSPAALALWRPAAPPGPITPR